MKYFIETFSFQVSNFKVLSILDKKLYEQDLELISSGVEITDKINVH